MSERIRYRFAEFELDTAAERLTRSGEEIALAPQPFALLRLLLEQHEQLITREQARERLWGDRQVEYEQGLNYCIRQIRAALDDSADAPRYVQTVPRRGYRFVAGVQRVEAGPRPLPGTRWGAAAAVALMALVVVVWLWPNAAGPSAQVILRPVSVEGLAPGDFVAAALLDRLRQDLGDMDNVDVVETFVTGGEGYRFQVGTSLGAEDAGIRLEVRLHEAGHLEPVWSAAGTASIQDLLPLEEDIRRDMRTFLDRFLGDETGEGEQTIERERHLPADVGGV